MPRTRSFIRVLAVFAVLSSSAEPSVAQALVDIGGHKLNIRCTGPSGAKLTVILEAGGGGSSGNWAKVQDELAPRVRSCAYDRAGLGQSEAGPAPRTVSQEVFELHALLEAAKVQGSLVLVGHSIGALNVRLYAERYGGEVAGMVLVDPVHESDVLYVLRVSRWARVRELATGRAVPPPRRDGPVSTQYNPDEDYLAEEFQQAYLSRKANPEPFGERPLIVVSAGKRPAPPGTSDSLWSVLRVEKDGQKMDLSRLSRNSRFILDPSSGHGIPTDNPKLVARAIEDVVAAAASGSRVTP